MRPSRPWGAGGPPTDPDTEGLLSSDPTGEGPELEVINVESPDKPANMGAGELQLEQGLYEHLELTDTPNLYALVEQRARNCLHSS
jgi:hypothetical protein